MKLKRTYFAGLLICIFYIGCSSGEYELKEVRVDYNEKQLVYDTIKTAKIEDTTTEKNNKQNNEVISKSDNFTFIVQIGAFIDKANFDNFFKAARAALGEAVTYQLLNNLYKVRIGNYNNKAEALKMLNYVKSLGYTDAFIITVNNK
ncbi:MAG: SPOR domain-containing protein [Ignavibacteriae bacterium]|nr:MAG: SPOR domain-containing protein [Ignavibacteriota bacterium]